jgi:hypothetical protein
LEAIGVLAQLDRDAVDRLRFWLTLAPSLPADVRPLRVAVAELVIRMTEVASQREEELRSVAADTMQTFQRLLEAATAARELPLGDAIVVRNEYQDLVGGHRLASADLVELHPDQFPSVAAVDQRRHRLRRVLGHDELRIRPRAPRMVDLALVVMDVVDAGPAR